MSRTFPSCVVALLAAASLHAQDTTIKTETKLKADDAKVMTISGCLRGGPTDFVLTNATAADSSDKKDKSVATAGVVQAYALVPRQGVVLAPHVGHRIELVGVVVEASKKSDDDAKISETTTKARIARGPSAQFAVTSLKMISPVCIE